MSIGGSIFLIAVGAILRYAVNADLAGIDIDTVGVILMITGAVGLAISLFFMAQASRSGPRRRRPPEDRPPEDYPPADYPPEDRPPPPDDRPPPR